MQVKDISDEACKDAAQKPGRTVDNLMAATGAPYKVAHRKLEQMVDRGLMECGVSIDTAWWAGPKHVPENSE